MSNLVNAFLAPVGKKTSLIVEINEVGKVGVLTSLTMKQRAEYFNERKSLEDSNGNALLLQTTVFDPETEEHIFKKLSLDDINNLPTYVTDPLVKVALQAIGVTPEMIAQQVNKEAEPEELKNSANDQS